MRRTMFSATLLISCLAGAAGAQATPTPDVAALRREVESLNRQMEAAFNRGGLKGAAAFYADNAVMRSAHEVAAQGRAAIDRYFRGISNPKSWKLDVYGVTAGVSNTVYETGMSTLVSGSPERTSKFQFLVVWQRQSNGALRIVLDYYHLPEPAGTR